MKVREIIVPKSLEAEFNLDLDLALEDDLDIIQLNQQEFDKLWHSDIFNLINNILPEALIDDYESASILDENSLNEVLKALESKNGYDYYLIQHLADSIIVFFRKALTRKTGVHFYF